MAHRERADEDVDLAVVGAVEEEHALAAVQGVEGDLRLVALGPEELAVAPTPFFAVTKSRSA